MSTPTVSRFFVESVKADLLSFRSRRKQRDRARQRERELERVRKPFQYARGAMITLIAASGFVFLARAAFEEAVKQWPDQKLALRNGIPIRRSR